MNRTVSSAKLNVTDAKEKKLSTSQNNIQKLRKIVNRVIIITDV